MKSRKLEIAIWVAIHVIVISLGLAVPWKVDTDLYSVLPDSNELRNVSSAEKALSARSMRNISVLVGHEDFATAKAAAATLYENFKDDSSLSEVRFYMDENALQENRDFLFENRYVLQGPTVREALRSGNAEMLENAALQKVYGAFSLADLNRLDEDPLLLSEQAFDYFMLGSPLMGGKFGIRDGVLCAVDSAADSSAVSAAVSVEKNVATNVAKKVAKNVPVFYVMWSAVLSEGTSSISSDGHVLARLSDTLDSLSRANPGLRVAKSGVPFHSFESSRNAQSEIAWISGISMALILLLLLYVFRSGLPVIATIFSITLAAAMAMAGTWAIFGSVHIFTFVFGTSVIGVSIDYAIHFFTGWKSGESGVEVRRHIFKGLLLGFATTELSYIALTFADFPLLRQMAVFSLIGLASSFSTILLLFPSLRAPRRGGGLPSAAPNLLLGFYGRLPAQKFPRILAGVVFVAALVPGLYLLNVQTDMRSLYRMSDELKSSEILNARLNDLGISANYFIVEGDSPEDVLEREENLTERLAAAEKDSLLKAHLATSSFLPSVKVQQSTFESVKSLAPSLKPFIAELGLPNDSAFMASLQANPAFLTPESHFPSSTKSLLDMLWIGEVDGKYYSAVFPLHVTPAFSAEQVACGLPRVFAVNKMDNINRTLTELSHVALMLVCAAYLVVFLILIFVYKLKDAVKIIRAPVLACVFLAAVFGYCGIAFNFFAIVGVILTLGIGIDYALFFREGGKSNLVTTLAVMLSAFTTLISFGSLSLSSFTPVATFGLAVLLGIFACFALAPLSSRR